VADATEEFARDYAFPAIQANALYENRYPLSTALARPLIAKLLVEAAAKYGADAVAHGCTGKGNDQVRFDVAIMSLNPNLKVLAPAREWGMSRDQTIAYGEKCGVESPVKKSSPFPTKSSTYFHRFCIINTKNAMKNVMINGPIKDLKISVSNFFMMSVTKITISEN
jgi:argininosuccinate synthase